jgi:HK97 family phage major capsid protein
VPTKEHPLIREVKATPDSWELKDRLDAAEAKLSRRAGELKTVNDRLDAGDRSPGTRERAENTAAALLRAEAERNEILREYKAAIRDEMAAGRVGIEYGDGHGPRDRFADGRDPLDGRPVGPEVKLVDLLKAAGRFVGDEEWRLGMLGAIIQGRPHVIESYARHLTKDSHALTLPNGDRLNGSQTKDLLIGSSAGTAALTPDVVAAQVIDRLRANVVVQKLGAQVVPMRSDTTKVPRITGDPTVSWLAEGATVTASDATLDTVDFTARRLTGLVKASQEIVEDAAPVSVGQVLEASFGGALAVELDRVALKGSGTAPEPRGIRNQSGVSVNATAAAASWAVIAERVGVLVGLNIPVDRIGVAVNTASWTTIMSQAEAGGQPIARPPFLADLQVLPTSALALPATGELYAGDYSELMIGIRLGLDFQVLRERYADEGKVGFLPRVRADVQVAHGASFALRTALSS